MRPRSRLTAVLSASFVALGLGTVPAVSAEEQRPATQSSDETDFPWEEDEEGGPAVPDAWSLRQRAFPERTIPQGAYERALDQARTMRTAGGPAPDFTDGDWQFAGPERVGGRVVGLAVDPDDAGNVYAAAATGGIWKSTDAGRNFTSTWDDSRTQSMGALAVTSDGTLYAGTGEPNMGGGSVVYPGTGMYRSTDDGQSWEQIGLSDSGTIGDIAVDPTDPGRHFVAASGPIFNEGGQRGLYRTTDGGETYELVLPPQNETTGAVDVAIDPEDPDTVYATTWDRIRYPDLRRYGGPGSGVYRSTDGGNSWEQLTNGLPNPEDGVGRIGLAVAPSDPDRLYAIVIASDGYFEGFYTSSDGGDSWDRAPESERLDASQSSFGWWFGKVWVEPDDAGHVFVAGVPLVESTDGGRSWSAQARDFHVDQHAMTWSQHSDGRVYLGNDGGVYRSQHDGSLDQPWIEALHEPYTQFYTTAVSRQDPSRISGGTQDNGSVRSWGGEHWNTYLGGDGLQNLIDPRDQRTVYGCYQYGNCFRSEDGGDNLTDITDGTVSDRRQWKTPLVFDPSDPSTLYYGGNRVNRSTDQGRSWEVISPDLTGGPDGPWPGGGGPYPYGTVTAITVAPSDPDRIYAGTDDSRVWTSPDGGQTWNRLDTGAASELPDQWVTSIEVSPRKPGTVYVTFSGYRQGEDTPHVFKSRDAGGTWNDISGDLPDAPVNDLVLHPRQPNRLYVATDVGVFGTRAGGHGAGWFAVGGDALPLAPVTDIEYHDESQLLTAATFGRGIYQISQERGG